MKQIKQKKNISIFVLTVLAFGIFFVSPALASEINAENIVKYVNEARAKEGFGNLEISAKLNDVAMAKVMDMVAYHYFAHTSPAGITPWYWFEKNGYNYTYAGENLAINFITAEDQQKAWMNSPTHRKNILNSNYKEIGVAVAVGKVNGQQGIISVQEFGTLVNSNIDGGNKDNFTVAKDKVLPDNKKFIPSVLSAKEVSLGNNSKKSFDLKNDFLFEKVSIDNKSLDFILSLVALFLVLPLILVQFSLLAKFFKLRLVFFKK